MIGKYLDFLADLLRKELDIPASDLQITTPDLRAYPTCSDVFYALHLFNTAAIPHGDESNEFYVSLGLTVSARIPAQIATTGDLDKFLREPFDFHERMPGLSALLRVTTKRALLLANAEADNLRASSWKFSESPTIQTLGLPPEPRTGKWWGQDSSHLMGFSATVLMDRLRIVLAYPGRGDADSL